MDDNRRTAFNINELANEIYQNALRVIMQPALFYRSMARQGGFLHPFIFMVAMGVVAAVLGALLTAVGLGPPAPPGTMVLTIIVMPILVGIFGFVSGGILFIIWRLLGSDQNYETAYRCGAYASAITPITTIINLVPYVGVLVTLAWMLYLMVTASREVHKIAAQKAWVAFGILFGLLALLSIGSQRAAHRMQETMQNYESHLQVPDQHSEDK